MRSSLTLDTMHCCSKAAWGVPMRYTHAQPGCLMGCETADTQKGEDMKGTKVILVGGVVLSSALIAQTSFAQGTPSSKATAAINTAVGCTLASQTTLSDTVPASCHDIFTGTSIPTTADNFVTIMTSTIKVSNSQSLFVSP